MIPIAKPLIGKEERQAVSNVLKSGMIACGPKTSEFEAAFANYTGTRYAIGTTSGTTALHLGLLSLDVGRGDEVIIPAFSFIATANVVLFCNGKPVFCDVDPQTFNIEIAKIEDLITERTKVIMPVHLYGQPANMRELEEIAERHDVRLLGDACQAHGAKYGGKTVGSFGDLECFSFYPTKNMTTGEGGMLTTDNEEIAETAYALRNHGREETQQGYEHNKAGYNYRMTDVAAAIGLEQLKKLPQFNDKRKENAAFFTEKLGGVDGINTPTVLKNAEHVYHQYTIKCTDREGVINELEKNKIGYGVYYPKPLHFYPHLRQYAHSNLVHAEALAKQVVSLPVHPAVSLQDIKKISSVVTGACQYHGR